jgi:hypothetical protein
MEAISVSFSQLAFPIWAPLLILTGLCAGLLFVLIWRDAAAERSTTAQALHGAPGIGRLIAQFVDRAGNPLARSQRSAAKAGAPCSA